MSLKPSFAFILTAIITCVSPLIAKNESKQRAIPVNTLQTAQHDQSNTHENVDTQKEVYDTDEDQEPQATTRTITVKNDIEPHMLTYKHWTGTYEPSTFILKVNDQVLEPGKQKTITIEDDTLNVRYDYAFLGGMRKGAKEIEFEVEKNTNQVDVSFSWDNKWRVIADHADPQAITRLKFGK